jgi:SWI/SNF-related matrix-associated actin-dependent regulator of chromatin subfamily A member 5
MHARTRAHPDATRSAPPSALALSPPLSRSLARALLCVRSRDIDALYASSGSQLAANKGRLLNLVMQLRKCCNHPYLFEGAEDKVSTRADTHTRRLARTRERARSAARDWPR